MDAYDHMVAYLTERPSEIENAWFHPRSHVAGRLFAFVEPDNYPGITVSDGRRCGCLTMIHDNPKEYGAWTEAIEIAIRADERIPHTEEDITPDHLPVFAGWQRRIDKILNRTPPVWNGPPCAKPEVEMEAPPSVEVEVASE